MFIIHATAQDDSLMKKLDFMKNSGVAKILINSLPTFQTKISVKMDHFYPKVSMPQNFFYFVNFNEAE